MANSKKKAIFAGDAARQRAELFQAENGGHVFWARKIIAIKGDTTQQFGGGYVVTPRRPTSGKVRVKNFEATLAQLAEGEKSPE